MLVFILSLIVQTNSHKISCSYDFDSKIKELYPTEKKYSFTEKKDGLKYNFFIEDYRKPSEINDYVVISDEKNSMTYSLKCN